MIGWHWIVEFPSGNGFGTQSSGWALTRRGALREARRAARGRRVIVVRDAVRSIEWFGKDVGDDG